MGRWIATMGIALVLGCSDDEGEAAGDTDGDVAAVCTEVYDCMTDRCTSLLAAVQNAVTVEEQRELEADRAECWSMCGSSADGWVGSPEECDGDPGCIAKSAHVHCNATVSPEGEADKARTCAALEGACFGL